MTTFLHLTSSKVRTFKILPFTWAWVLCMCSLYLQDCGTFLCWVWFFDNWNFLLRIFNTTSEPFARAASLNKKPLQYIQACLDRWHPYYIQEEHFSSIWYCTTPQLPSAWLLCPPVVSHVTFQVKVLLQSFFTYHSLHVHIEQQHKRNLSTNWPQNTPH